MREKEKSSTGTTYLPQSCEAFVSRLRRMHEMQAIAADVPVRQSVSLCVSQFHLDLVCKNS